MEFMWLLRFLELANTSGETIRKCLIGLQKTAYGYIWKYNK